MTTSNLDFDGIVYRLADDGYEEARRAAVWNALKPDRKPAVIVVAGSHEDVSRAVALAREEGLSIGVRSGGHSWEGNAVRDGGLLLDLSRLKSIVVDPEARVATFEPGVRSMELTEALAAHGLHYPGGHCPTVGVTGFTLGGGFGFNSRKLGPAAFSLRAIDVVTADGESLHATDDQYEDVLWAARGGGPGFFAAVTRMHVDLRPWPGVIASTMQAHRLAAYDELVHWFEETAPLLPEEVSANVVVTGSPLPGQDETVILVLAYAVTDSLDHAAALMAPLETAPGLDNAIAHAPVTESSLPEYYALMDQMYPKGLRYLSHNMSVNASDELWRDLKPKCESLPNSRTQVLLTPWFPRTHPNAAISMPSDWVVQFYVIYEYGADDGKMLSWMADAIDRVDPHWLGGGHINDAMLSRHPMAVLEPKSAARLEVLRDKYDPDRVFDSYSSQPPLARVNRT